MNPTSAEKPRPMVDDAVAASGRRLVIVSNRLPVVLARSNGVLQIQPGSGGLVTALAPVLRNRGGLWVGWPGTIDEDEEEVGPLVKQMSKRAGFSFHPVLLNSREVDLYYHGFSNEIIWPLFHDLQSRCNFNPDYWRSYQEVNRTFARKVMEQVHEDDYIWVHDYHLLQVAKGLRELGCKAPLGFFLHIPFPPLDIFIKLPWRFQVLRALLEYDLLGFQTMRDRRNFIHCVRSLLKDVHVHSAGSLHVCHAGAREIRVGCFPISIDFGEFERLASDRDVAEEAWYIHEAHPDQKMVLGVDRLDYTKGIPYRLEAFRVFLRQHPELHRKVTMIQIVVPSRIDIPKYNDLKMEIERLVGEINGEFTQSGWVPIYYVFRRLRKKELLSYYRTSEIALITPIKDGMNLVAKEYSASNIEERGVLILSEFAGAASQLQRFALLVNPYDVEGVAAAIHEAVVMPEGERRNRMRRMRRSIKRQDVFWWVRSFLSAAISVELVDFPLIYEYLPTAEFIEEGISV